jgi:PKD repeat protein
MTNSFFDLVHEYPDNGTYTFVVTEVGTGRTASIEVDVATATDLGPYPYGARGEISSTTGIATTTSIAFFDTSIVRDPPTSWLWSFGDSTTSTLQNPTHVYATAGAKNVTLAIDGGSPVAVGTVTVIAAPTWSASTVMADTFAVDGLMNNRAPTTPMVNVFDTWKAPLPSAVTLGGKYTNESTENGAPVSISQWETGDGTVVPPAQLLEWELSFDWANNTTLPFNIHNIIEASVYSILSGADQRRVAQLTWQPWVEDRWMFTLNAYPDDAGTSGSIQIARPAADVPLTIRIAFNDNKQYLFVGDQVVALAAANTPRAINNVTMQLGQKDTSNGTDKIDNLALKALT